MAAALVEKKELTHDHMAVGTPLQGKVAKKTQNGKRGIINIDVLSEHFNSGDSVTLFILKQMGLIAENVCRLKVLARGSINKALIVIADEFSLDAVKMIFPTGGRAIKK